MVNDEELKLCPFCGSTDLAVITPKGMPKVICNGCAARVEFASVFLTDIRNGSELHRFAINSWNKRHERTCEVAHKKSGPFYDVYEFPCCGYEISESRTDNGTQDLVLNYCPKCGAKVVGE